MASIIKNCYSNNHVTFEQTLFLNKKEHFSLWFMNERLLTKGTVILSVT